MVLALNAISIMILVFGVAKAVWDFIRNEGRGLPRLETAKHNNIIKNYLGTYILLGLEILIAADIIESIMNPTLEDILVLAAVVVIRTIISYFLGKEIENTQID
ncbi:DUF1622 domain-containing protein [Vagococcus sp. BWB3-3]|uniref:DUF1622 domain-containing protein n=1 Tax=Vagococcus allomyrinae TaxID=2794353 RepID=A0A940P8C4_9ENTE|nr:DUF1622 domain-containing protein [Vagococcus allomyrinae]MBP1040299.1 DUF1622 domain-containing protein [Vagococcus allomyrinae]